MKRFQYAVVLILMLGVMSACQKPEREVSAKMDSAIPASAKDVHPLVIGDSIPKLVLDTADGEAFDLNRAIEEKPSILIFSRGGGCPYCNLQLGQIQSIAAELRQMGYQILAISPDKPENLSASLGKNPLTYTLLSDHSMEAARTFGIAFRVDEATLGKYTEYGIDLEEASGEAHHLLPVPSVFVVDRGGIIQFSYSNPDYKVRIDPGDLVDAARAALDAKPQSNGS